MRIKQDRQGRLDFKPSNLKITNEFYDRFAAVSEILHKVPRVLNLVHKDMAKAIEQENSSNRKKGRSCNYTSENVLRILIVEKILGVSLREVVVRIDDSYMLREFTKIYGGPMMSHSIYWRVPGFRLLRPYPARFQAAYLLKSAYLRMIFVRAWSSSVPKRNSGSLLLRA